MRNAIRLRGGRGIFAPLIDERVAVILGALNGGPIRNGAALAARGFVDGHSHIEHRKNMPCHDAFG